MSPATPETDTVSASRAAVELVQCKDMLEFTVRAKHLLLHDEAANCLMVSIAMRLAAAPENGNHYAAVVQQNDQTIGAALRQSGYKLVITRAPDPALKAMAEAWPQDGTGLNHAAGPAPEIERFAAHYRSWTGRKSRFGLSQCLYRGDEVMAKRKVGGVMRLATTADLPLVKQWLAGYTSETQGPTIAIERHIAAQRLHIWVNNGPAAMASVSGMTPNSARLSLVYTPPAQRGQGYAQAIVAGLAQKMRTQVSFCTLFTDIDNPVSNAVYRKIGFKPVCNFLDVHFT